MTKNEFIEIIKDYEGLIREQEHYVIFSARNCFKHYENCETEKGKQFVEKDKIVYCEFVFDEKNNILSGEEKTFEIRGGFSMPEPKREYVIARLQYYNFREKEFIPLV